MANQQLSREEQLIAFFVNQCDGELGRTRLMKLVYLADYEARRYLGRAVSEIPYVWHNHGPYDMAFIDRLNRLAVAGIIRQQSVLYPNGNTGYLYEPGPLPVQYEFSPAEIEILSYVCHEYSRVDLRELLDDVVYQTEPMVEAQANNRRGQPLNMALVNNVAARQLGASLDTLVSRSADARAGRVISHADAMAALA